MSAVTQLTANGVMGIRYNFSSAAKVAAAGLQYITTPAATPLSYTSGPDSSGLTYIHPQGG